MNSSSNIRPSHRTIILPDKCSIVDRQRHIQNIFERKNKGSEQIITDMDIQSGSSGGEGDSGGDEFFWQDFPRQTPNLAMSKIPVPIGASVLSPMGLGKTKTNNSNVDLNTNLMDAAGKHKITRGTSPDYNESRKVSSASSQIPPKKASSLKECEYGLASKLAAEFLGVFCLVFLGSLAANESTPGNVRLHTAFATGFCIFIMVASVGQISGGHFNPAVSWAVALAGKMPMSMVFPFTMAQLSGGFIGALVVRLVIQPSQYASIAGGTTVFPETNPFYQALIIEAVLTAILVQTILNAVVERPKNPLGPLAIGCTVMVDIIACGPLTMASMNPARSFGPCLAATFSSDKINILQIWTDQIVYWLGPFIGATFSSIIFRFLFAIKPATIKWSE